MVKFIAGLGLGLGVTLAVALVVMPSPFSSENKYGRFVGEVNARFLEDGRYVELKEDFGYIDPNDKVWLAPAGSVVDGASIPQVFWSFIGGPFAGQFRNASIIHDVGCQQMTEPSEEVHQAFYYACRCAGVGEAKAKAMYYAVSKFGPHWDSRAVLAASDAAATLPGEVETEALTAADELLAADAPPQPVVSEGVESAVPPPQPSAAASAPSGAGPRAPSARLTVKSYQYKAPSGGQAASRSFKPPSAPKAFRQFAPPQAKRVTSGRAAPTAKKVNSKRDLRAATAMPPAKRAAPTKQQAQAVLRFFETHQADLEDIPELELEKLE